MPQQIGVAKYHNRTIVECACSMVVKFGLPIYLWSEAILTTNYLVNRSSMHSNQAITFDKKFSRKKPSISHLKVFSYIVHYYVPKKTRTKLESKS